MRVKKHSGSDLVQLAQQPKVFAGVLLLVVTVLGLLLLRPNDTTDIGRLIQPCEDTSITTSTITSTSTSTALRSSASAAVPKQQQPPMTDSTDATVMGFAVGYDVGVFKRFVGTLRNSGFKGHIILGVAPDIRPDAVTYLESKNVQIAKVTFTECTHGMFDDEDKTKEATGHEKEARSCVAPYDKLKSRWERFPFLRDRLKECQECTGPVLITDVRDVFFQRDPFGSGHPQVQGLQVFEEHVKQRTLHWLAKWPIETCKGVVYNRVMLCSGTTIGTRQAMIDYLDAMEAEMKVWMDDKKCHFKINGDDQSIHNYLYYSGKLPFAKAIPNRMGIVNTPGVQGSIIRQAHAKRMKLIGKGENDPYPDRDPAKNSWLPQEYDLTDEDGYFVDFDGNRSAVVHQFERFGHQVEYWLRDHTNLVDK